MRMTILVAIATLILGLGSMYTTAKASQSSIFEFTTVSTVQVPYLEPVTSSSVGFVPLPAVQDQLNEIVKQKEVEIRQREVKCLANNIYFEARGESKAGKIAVGQVTINRVKAGTFEDSICGVVHQHNSTYRNQPVGCQFEWFCNGSKHKIVDQETYTRIMDIAEDLYDNYYMGTSYPDIVNGALYFHERTVDVAYRGKRVVARIDNHVFYTLVAKL
jgi:spore germination cell wall hydrolase CwlJ-like protein